MITPALAAILQIGDSIIKRVIPDPVMQAEARLRLLEMQQAGELQEMDAKMQIIVAEAKSEHPLTSTWRPITMLTFVAIVANNYIVYPYLSLFWASAPILSVPDNLWDLLQIGLGGYVVGRTGEKMIDAWKAAKVAQGSATK